jgi:uncharacterized Zn-binding protein involved in type VI secretion
MPFIAKLGDVTADGGVIVGPGWPNVTLNGIPLARPGAGEVLGDKIAPHACCGEPSCFIHCISTVEALIMIGRITVNGFPMVVQGDIPTCKVPIATQTIPTLAFAGP